MNMNKSPQIVVVGSLNTDIIISGLDRFPKPGQQVYANEFKIGPGGKSRNIAQMAATLTSKNVVAMIGKSLEDPYNLWQQPINALKNAGVIVDYVKILDSHKTIKFPGIAVIPVDIDGNNSIYVIPGINDDFSKEDIISARGVIKSAKFMVVTLEIPIETALYAIAMANSFGVKVLLDPGGISKDKDPSEILKHKLFLLKPNEYEAQTLTGIEVKDFSSAKKAAKKLLSRNLENLLITHGKNGAYYFGESHEEHIGIPSVQKTNTRDETGCGDQTMATITAFLNNDSDILNAVKAGILAGTLQLYKAGITPVTKEEINKYL